MSREPTIEEVKAWTLTGCGDSGCYVKKPTGMATNGGCRCFDKYPMHQVIRVLCWEIRDLRAELENLKP